MATGATPDRSVGASELSGADASTSPPHPRTIGWIGTAALAMGGSNQSLFLIGALILGQGSAAVPLLILGLLLSWAAAPGWTELILMWPNRVGGIAATCAEAFRPYSPVLANLTGVCYWWGWVPTCGLTAILSATAIHEWYLPNVPVPALATLLVLFFTVVNLCGVKWATRVAIPIATVSATLAFLSGLVPILTGHVNWRQATTFHLIAPFHGAFGGITGAMAGLYLIGFGAPAFEAAACHVGETVDPVRNVPRAMLASALMAAVYFVALPVIWLGVLGPGPLMRNLQQSLDPTFAPLLGNAAHAAAIWFMMVNMFHGTLQPLAGAARTLLQLAEDGLLPRLLARRSRTDAPWVATLLTAGMAILFLLGGDPVWVIAAANLTYLIGIALPSVAVWLLRRNEPARARPYRAPRGTIGLGLVAAGVWGLSTVLGFEQYGLPTVVAGLALAYSGSALYVLRIWGDRRRAGLPVPVRTLHLKLTGAMLLVLSLDSAGYLLAVSSLGAHHTAYITLLEDIFVAVALLTVSVGLVLPGIIAHAVGQTARAADHLATGTLADLSRAMQALSAGDLEGARAQAAILPVVVHTRDEVRAMAESFNLMQTEAAQVATALDGAREGLRRARDELTASNAELARWSAELEQRVLERTSSLRTAHDTLAALNRVAEAVIGASGFDVMCDRALDAVTQVLGAGDGWIMAHDDTAPPERRLQLVAWRGLSDETASAIATLPLGCGISGLAALRRTVVLSSRLDEMPLAARDTLSLARQEGLEGCVSVPLLARGHLLGVLSVATRVPRGWSESDLGLLQTAAKQLAAALEAERLRSAAAAADAALAADRLKGELLSTVSHELRTPLGAIKGFASSLLHYGERIDEDERTMSLRLIEEAADRLGELIDNLLDLQRLEAGRLDVALGLVDLPGVVSAVVAEMARQAPTHRLELTGSDVPPVRGDARRLRQVVQNLVENAIKYSPGGGRIAVLLSAHDGAVELRVQDEGVGIPPDQLALIFQRFHRVDNSTTRRIGGTGLGLSIVKGLVAAHGGAIRAESAGEGCGSTFVVSLPAARDGAGVPA